MSSSAQGVGTASRKIALAATTFLFVAVSFSHIFFFIGGRYGRSGTQQWARHGVVAVWWGLARQCEALSGGPRAATRAGDGHGGLGGCWRRASEGRGLTRRAPCAPSPVRLRSLPPFIFDPVVTLRKMRGAFPPEDGNAGSCMRLLCHCTQAARRRHSVPMHAELTALTRWSQRRTRRAVKHGAPWVQIASTRLGVSTGAGSG